ncbi:EscU/YscU/HrcU family type III secretion system export apparatus switch protein [Lentibacillus sp. N15]|uniref:EscU/YscU/HrcU family type III secretion system export apparatus switch protein n=1 Tax=Lentibacillus songyuanensis TaxID=3136161 RepID=UPI0031B9AE0B
MNEKRKKAVALRYNHQINQAPKVTATGKGLLAESIVEKAKRHHVPVQEDESLVELLAELNINETIPEELYQAVAEVFAFIYQTDRSMGDTNS